MIIEVPDDNSIVRWKKNDKDEWKSAEISDLIMAQEKLDKNIELYKSKVAFYESQNTRGEYAVTVRELKYVVEILEALQIKRLQGD